MFRDIGFFVAENEGIKLLIPVEALVVLFFGTER